uniref:Adhesion G protein-coupled receptor G1 n=1 Tax=Neogobius melanostomus TaxID=47308 RepID=A0A8C6WEH2_9GOBI
IITNVCFSVSGEDDRNLNFCGVWRHGKGPLSLNVDLTKGCDRIVVSADQSSLSVKGQITVQCTRLVTIPLVQIKPTEDQTSFCVFWEPLLDQFKLKVKKLIPLCSPAPLKDHCCTHMSQAHKTRTSYEFNGSFINCRETFCDEARQGSRRRSMATMLQTEENPCAESTVLKLKDNVEDTLTFYVFCDQTFRLNIILIRSAFVFQEAKGSLMLIYPLKVNWLVEGCETKVKGETQTECHCNHLTYFTVLVQLEPKPVRHLLALTAITSLGCAVSLISCIALIVYLCRKSRRPKEQSIPIHLGLAVSLALLNLLFFLTGVLANVCESVCGWVGAALHYALLSSFTWMGIEIFHTFWLVQMVFSPTPKPWIWNLAGFGEFLEAVIVLAFVPDIYGLKEIHQSSDPHPYKMCWMQNNQKALLAHYVTNMTLLGILVTSGLVMLFLVYREIRNRDEWRQNRVAFLSIWGLSCLFGTTWGLTFLDFGPLTDVVLFVSCILNSLQGFFLMLRFYLLDWMRKQAGGSALGSSSTGSTRQHMLQTQEKS